MTDYWLSKLMFDLQDPSVLAAFRADREALMAKYQLAPEVKRGLIENDVAVLAPRVNPYLLRYYYQYAGVPDADLIAGLNRLKPDAKRDG
jgi:Aromatic-ring-opening dioxygenase LigAB, LigA subunit